MTARETRDWDAATYDRVSAPLEALGREVLDRLVLRGDETVVDAGCGSGRVTEALAERLPRGRVIAVDGSPSMVAATRERLGDRAGYVVSDLLALDLGGERVDAVLSTATFHWIADHDALFARLHALLEPGGRLVAQCGGAGNIAAVLAVIEEVAARAPYAEHLAGRTNPWNYATAQATEERLRAAGFAEARCWLEPRPVRPPEPLHYFATIMLGAHLEHLPEARREPFTRDVVVALGPEPIVDYVRLNIDATA